MSQRDRTRSAEIPPRPHSDEASQREFAIPVFERASCSDVTCRERGRPYSRDDCGASSAGSFSGEGGIRILAGADSGARSDADSRDSSRLATADEAVSHGGVRDERRSVVTRERPHPRRTGDRARGVDRGPRRRSLARRPAPPSSPRRRDRRRDRRTPDRARTHHAADRE
jgi:hypothetical protein